MSCRRAEFFAMIDEVRERNQDIPPEVIEAEVAECIREARQTRRTLEQTCWQEPDALAARAAR